MKMVQSLSGKLLIIRDGAREGLGEPWPDFLKFILDLSKKKKKNQLRPPYNFRISLLKI